MVYFFSRWLLTPVDLLTVVSESTSSRVHWLSLTTVFIVVVLGIWQIMYLKQYFMQKKLI